MIPAPSWCGTTRGKPVGREPARDFTSVGFSPETTTRTRTSPGPGSGMGSSPIWRTSAAAPTRSYHTARIAASLMDRDGTAVRPSAIGGQRLDGDWSLEARVIQLHAHVQGPQALHALEVVELELFDL